MCRSFVDLSCSSGSFNIFLGFTGKRCGFNINDCRDNECPANSVCVDGINGYTCQCGDGKIGEDCQKGTHQSSQTYEPQ